MRLQVADWEAMQCLRQGIEMEQRNYPETFAHIWLVRPPWIFSAIFSMVRFHWFSTGSRPFCGCFWSVSDCFAADFNPSFWRSGVAVAGRLREGSAYRHLRRVSFYIPNEDSSIRK